LALSRPPARSAAPQRAPRQDRSRRTRERLLEATVSLLAERDYGEVSIDDIVDRAHSSIGAFYKHFPGKRELLPELLQRLEAQGSEQLATLLGEPQHAAASLPQRIGLLLGAMTQHHLQRRRLLRAFVAARFNAQLALRPADIAAARARMQAMRDWLLVRRREIRHPEPDLAVRAGLYLVLQSLQTALLFEDLPAELPPTRLTDEAARMLCAYLQVPPARLVSRLARRPAPG
jgi:AcrR family transcriptional regulator